MIAVAVGREAYMADREQEEHAEEGDMTEWLIERGIPSAPCVHSTIKGDGK